MDVTNVECKSAAFPNLSKRDDLTAETVPFQPLIPGVIVLFIFAQVFREYYGMKVKQDLYSLEYRCFTVRCADRPASTAHCTRVCFL